MQEVTRIKGGYIGAVNALLLDLKRSRWVSPYELHWALRSESRIVMIHGGVEVKECGKYNDYYGYLTSFEDGNEGRHCEQFSITPESSLELVVVVDVVARAYLSNAELQKENFSKDGIADALKFIEIESNLSMPIRANLDGRRVEFGFCNIVPIQVASDVVIWSSKNSPEKNAAIRAEFKETYGDLEQIRPKVLAEAKRLYGDKLLANGSVVKMIDEPDMLGVIVPVGDTKMLLLENGKVQAYNLDVQAKVIGFAHPFSDPARTMERVNEVLSDGRSAILSEWEPGKINVTIYGEKDPASEPECGACLLGELGDLSGISLDSRDIIASGECSIDEFGALAVGPDVESVDVDKIAFVVVERMSAFNARKVVFRNEQWVDVIKSGSIADMMAEVILSNWLPLQYVRTLPSWKFGNAPMEHFWWRKK